MLTKEQEQWLQALESGNYKQGQTRLCTIEKGERKYCCLGVATEIFAEQLGIASAATIDGCMMKYFHGGASETGGALPCIQKLLGLQGALASLKKEIVLNMGALYATKLTTLNDAVGWTFKQIAEYIRANPENVFNKQAEPTHAT